MKLKKGSKKYWRAVTISIMAWFRVNKEAIRNRLAIRKNQLADLDSAMVMYNEIAKAWVMRAIKKPLISMISDQTLNFDFMDPMAHQIENAHRLMQLKVRLKGVFLSFVDYTTDELMPHPLIIFMASLC